MDPDPPPVPRGGPVGPLWVRARTACSRVATAALVTGSVLVLSPHPDDETIACGLLLAATAARGDRVSVALATDGGLGWFGDGPAPPPDEVAAVRSAEWHLALDILGVERGARHELALPDGDLGAHEAAAAAAVSRILADEAPSRVFLPSPDDLHADHRALARAALRAVASGAAADRVPALFTYRVYPEAGLWPAGADLGTSPLGAAWRLARSLPLVVRDRDLALHAPEQASRKARALAAYVSQCRLLGGSAGGVWGRGVELFRPIDVRPP
jgi:LmbE family N-acetylglucosaminyl deacetylase